MKSTAFSGMSPKFQPIRSEKAFFARLVLIWNPPPIIPINNKMQNNLIERGKVFNTLISSNNSNNLLAVGNGKLLCWQQVPQ